MGAGAGALNYGRLSVLVVHPAMDLPRVSEARRLVTASMRSQAALAGFWQEYQSFCWWQSGLQAAGANLLLDCGTNPKPASLIRLAVLLRWSAAPVGWLIWPDQSADLQQQLLAQVGFCHRESIWLGFLPAERLDPKPLCAGDSDLIQVLRWSDAVGYAHYLEQCHQICHAYSRLITATFLNPSPPGMFKTLGVLKDGAVVASVTAGLMPGVSGSPPLGNLLWLGVLTPWRRRGLARAITEQACTWLMAKGVNRIHVQASPMAVGLYRSLGFRHCGDLALWGAG